jgi:hypothetical protein
MTLIQQQQEQSIEQAHRTQDNSYYDSLLYHLAEVSVFKLNNPSISGEKEPTLRRQLLVRNLLILSSNLIITNQSIQQEEEEEVWLNSCFDQLIEEDEDAYMEEEEEVAEEETEQQQQQGQDCGQLSYVEGEKDNKNIDNLLVMAFPFDYCVQPSHEDQSTIRRKGTLFFM